eukprot:COSAG05_NODE_10915_length_539_cov_1.034091_1_plen_89_part_00
MFGRERHHTARVTSRHSAKVKFVSWATLLRMRAVRVGAHRPGDEIFKRGESSLSVSVCLSFLSEMLKTLRSVENKEICTYIKLNTNGR